VALCVVHQRVGGVVYAVPHINMPIY
jgi:hypothetical protein